VESSLTRLCNSEESIKKKSRFYNKLVNMGSRLRMKFLYQMLIFPSFAQFFWNSSLGELLRRDCEKYSLVSFMIPCLQD
jgi:hypothetical protein